MRSLGRTLQEKRGTAQARRRAHSEETTGRSTRDNYPFVRAWIQRFPAGSRPLVGSSRDARRRPPIVHAALVAFAVLGTLALILAVVYLAVAFLFASPY